MAASSKEVQIMSRHFIFISLLAALSSGEKYKLKEIDLDFVKNDKPVRIFTDAQLKEYDGSDVRIVNRLIKPVSSLRVRLMRSYVACRPNRLLQNKKRHVF